MLLGFLPTWICAQRVNLQLTPTKIFSFTEDVTGELLPASPRLRAAVKAWCAEHERDFPFDALECADKLTGVALEQLMQERAATTPSAGQHGLTPTFLAATLPVARRN